MSGVPRVLSFGVFVTGQRSMSSTAPRWRRTGYGLAVVTSIVLVAAGCQTRREMAEIGAAIGALEPTAPGSGDPSTDPALVGLARAARVFARGAEPLEQPLHGVFAPGQPSVDHIVELAEGSCYTMIAYADPAETDINLRIDDPTGYPVAEERAPDNFPVIGPFCSSSSGRFSVRALGDRRAVGAHVAIGVWRHDDAALADVSARMAARVATTSPGAVPIGGVMRDALEEGRFVEIPIALRAGECRLVAGAAEGSADDLDLELLDGAGGVSLRDIGVDRDPVLGPFCAEEARLVRVRLKAYRGTGLFYWRSWRTEEGTPIVDIERAGSGQ